MPQCCVHMTCKHMQYSNCKSELCKHGSVALQLIVVYYESSVFFMQAVPVSAQQPTARACVVASGRLVLTTTHPLLDSFKQMTSAFLKSSAELELSAAEECQHRHANTSTQVDTYNRHSRVELLHSPRARSLPSMHASQALCILRDGIPPSIRGSPCCTSGGICPCSR